MKKVLIVDDSETIRAQVATALVGAGFQVAEAPDGQQALDYVTDHEVDLMLLDMNMPILTGLEVLEQLSAKARTRKFPVVMLTTEAHLTLIEKAKRLGARAWIVKPVRMDQLVAAVTKLTTSR